MRFLHLLFRYPHRTTALRYCALLLLILFSSVPLDAQWHRNFGMKYSILDNGTVRLWHDHIGNLRPYGVGGRWKGQTILYDHGLHFIGKIRDTTKVIMDYWYSPYSPGPIIQNVPAIYFPGVDTSRFKPYNFSRNDGLKNQSDLDEWPADLGAPIDTLGRPRLFGDHMVWMVYNGLDTAARGFYPPKDPGRVGLPLEIRQTMYSYSEIPPGFPNFLNDVVFMEYQIYNRGDAAIDSLYYGFWTDIDFNIDTSNPPGVDTINQVGYCWTPNDSNFYDINLPLTVGYVLLKGPVRPSPGDSATFGETFIKNSENLPMTSFWGIFDDSYSDSSDKAPPYSVGTMWNVANGLHPRGYPMVDTTTGRVTRFSHPGDPVTGQGWIHPPYSSGGAGFIFFSGPISMAPSDSQWMMIAMVPTLGTNRLESIKNLRLKANILREYSVADLRGKGFDWNDSSTVDPIIPVYHELHQNYPNPFNPKTTFTFDVGVEADVEISVYTVLGQKIATLVNERKPIGRYTVDFYADGLASGMYICRMKIDYMILERKMVVLR
jgi:hypothetical protein